MKLIAAKVDIPLIELTTLLASEKKEAGVMPCSLATWMA
jgi:hypothetical protein